MMHSEEVEKKVFFNTRSPYLDRFRISGREITKVRNWTSQILGSTPIA